MQETSNKMGTTPILKLIISMSLPAMFSMLVQSLYNIVDSVFVAQYSQDALTALSLAFPIQTLIVAVGVGTGIGINSLISRRLGEKRLDEASKAATHGIVLGVLSGLVFAVLGLFFTNFFFSCFTKTPAVLQAGCDYIYIITFLCFGQITEMILEKTIQATGDMIHPMIMLLSGAITNIILDPILIFGWGFIPSMGVSGAALATVIGQMVSLTLGLYVIYRKNDILQVSLRRFRFHGRTLKDIYQVGFPSIIMQSITSITVTLMNAILVGFSETAVTVMGIYYKLQSFVFMPVFGLTHGLLPIMGYNYGSRNRKRLMDAFRYGNVIALGIMLIGMLIFLFFPRLLLQIFNAQGDLMALGIPALRIIAISFMPAAVSIVCSSFFNAVGKGSRSLAVSLLRQLIVILPIAYLLSLLTNDVNMVWWSFPIAEVVSLIVSLWLVGLIDRKEITRLETM